MINYKAVAEWLYAVLDDIDSADDMAKADDKEYRKVVSRLQRLKSEVGCSNDGYTVEFKEPSQEYGLTRLFTKDESRTGERCEECKSRVEAHNVSAKK